MKKLPFLSLLIIAVLWNSAVYAQDFGKDLALEEGSIRTQNNVIVGKTVRIYATVKNNSSSDLIGTVKFYDEGKKEFIGVDQPVSVIAQATDDVFVDWEARSVGNFLISARVIPWDTNGDNPDNNKITTAIYVDIDSDGDGIPNAQDGDDDNDGTPDGSDAFPNNPAESEDTDKDTIGNNADTDDDGDGSDDVQDLFPTDSAETVDKDSDGIGDNTDAFPDNAAETVDIDEDGLGDNEDPNTSNKGPVVVIDTEDNVVSTGTVVTFNALKSKDLDGEITTYEWDFGDGVASTSVVVDHVFEKAGTYEVKLKVIDDKGEYRVGMISMTVIYRWQTIALIVILLLLLLLLIYNVKHAKKTLAKKKQKK